jgi:membrane-bound ClpP family serine protease
MGFENVVGKSGLAIEQLKPKGTIRIGHELWQARSEKTIKKGSQVSVTSQSGLNLIVVEKRDS